MDSKALISHSLLFQTIKNADTSDEMKDMLLRKYIQGFALIEEVYDTVKKGSIPIQDKAKILFAWNVEFERAALHGCKVKGFEIVDSEGEVVEIGSNVLPKSKV